ALVSAVTATGGGSTGWSCTTGACVPYSLRLYRALDGREPGGWKIFDGKARETRLLIDGQGVLVNPRHTFPVHPAGAGTENEIIVDSTYLQYIRGGVTLPVDRIFVGTRAELIAFFTRYRDLINPKFISRETTGRIDPVEFVEAHYGFGRYNGR